MGRCVALLAIAVQALCWRYVSAGAQSRIGVIHAGSSNAAPALPIRDGSLMQMAADPSLWAGIADANDVWQTTAASIIDSGSKYMHKQMQWTLYFTDTKEHAAEEDFDIRPEVPAQQPPRVEHPLVSLPPILRQQKRKRVKAIHYLYNPDLNDDCFYQSVLYGLGLSTDKAHVEALRCHLASLWEARPADLERVAREEQLTGVQYLRGIKSRMWGGSPEMDLLGKHHGIGFCVLNVHKEIEYESHGKVQFVLLRHAEHFYFLKRKRDMRNAHPTTGRSRRAGMPLKLVTKAGDMSIEVPSDVDVGEDAVPPSRPAPSPPRERTPLQRRKRSGVSSSNQAPEAARSTQETNDETNQTDGQKDETIKAGAMHQHPLDIHADLEMLKPGDKPANQHHVQHAIAQYDAQPVTWEDLTDQGPWNYRFPKEGSMCLLCRKWMGTGHVQSAGHVKKFAQYTKCTPAEREDWLDTIRLNLGCWSPKADEKWIRQKEGFPWCALCDATATVSHLQSQGHRQEVGASEFNLEHSKHIIASIRVAEAREAALQSTGSSSSTMQRAGMPQGVLALPQPRWTNVSIYRADYPAWRQIKHGAAGYWSYEMREGVTGKEIRQKIGADLHVKQSRVQLWDEHEVEVADAHILEDCLLSLKIRPRCDSQTQAAVSRVIRAPLARGRVVLQLCKLKQKLRALSARVRRLEACVRGTAKRRDPRGVFRAGAIHHYLTPPLASYPMRLDVLVYIHGLPEITEMTVPQGTTLIQVKNWLLLHGWTFGPIVQRKMLRVKDDALLFTADHLVFRRPCAHHAAHRAGAPKALPPWESSSTVEGIKNVAKITLDDTEVAILTADNLHQGSQGAVFVTVTTWLRHAELRTSEEVIWIFPGSCSAILRKHGALEEHVTTKQMLLQQPAMEAPVRRNTTILYQGKKGLSVDKGLTIVQVETSQGCELLLELDPRWVVQDTLRLVKQDWKIQAPALASAALQRTLSQSDIFAYRQPTETNPCWTARLYLSQEQALKMLTTSGQRSLFVRPVRTDTAEWKSLWTIVWSNLPDVAELNLLSVILKHAEQHAGHVGIARAYRNLGLRVPWTTVKSARDNLRPADHALSEHNRALRDDKSFKISGVPRGALAKEVCDACQAVGWTAIPQARLPSRPGKEDEWWATAAAGPTTTNFLWNGKIIMVTPVEDTDIRKARKPNARKNNATEKEGPSTVDPLQASDPWRNATAKWATSSAPGSSSSSTAPKPATADSAGSNTTPVTSADPRVTALAQRVEKLEGETKELHTKMDTVDGKVDSMGVSMSTQFTEVLRLLGALNDRKRGQPEAGS